MANKTNERLQDLSIERAIDLTERLRERAENGGPPYDDSWRNMEESNRSIAIALDALLSIENGDYDKAANGLEDAAREIEKVGDDYYEARLNGLV